jgi:hypothetical protein
MRRYFPTDGPKEGITVNIRKVNWEKIKDHPPRAVGFFKVMMRLEFALKENRYARQEGNQIVLCWDEYIDDRLGKGFFDEMRQSGKVRELIITPPKRQIINEGGGFSWIDVGSVANTHELIGAVRRIRNNLFHGGKSGDPDHGRSDVLIMQAMLVIKAVLENDEYLHASFSGEY